MNSLSTQQLILGSGTLSITGNSLFVNGLNLTGNLVSNTGQLTGAFYPLLNNPSSYITGFNSGIYITTGQTGAFYAASNPNSYITSSNLTPYYLNSNPSGFITGLNTGSFVTTGQTGIFSTTGWVNSNYYPRTNPSGYGVGGTNGGVSGISASGVAISGVVNFTGLGLSTYVSGQNIYIDTAINSSPITSVINWNLSNTFYKTLTSNTTFSFLHTKDGKSVTVLAINTGTAHYTITWPTTGTNGVTIKWPNNSIPIQTSGLQDIYSFVQINTGIYANAVQNF